MHLIGLDTAVYCNDNYCGINRHLIIHAQHLCLTHLVIFASHIERLVPISLMSEVSDMGIHLKWSSNELAKLDPFAETHFVEVSIPDFGLSEASYVYPHSGGLTWTHVPLIRYNIPPGTFVISRQTQIEAKNGYAGQFKGLIIDPDTYQINQLVFQRGHLWERKRDMVAASAIEYMEGDTIYLNIQKSAL